MANVTEKMFKEELPTSASDLLKQALKYEVESAEALFPFFSKSTTVTSNV
jgi:hypothetical protein